MLILTFLFFNSIVYFSEIWPDSLERPLKRKLPSSFLSSQCAEYLLSSTRESSLTLVGVGSSSVVLEDTAAHHPPLRYVHTVRTYSRWVHRSTVSQVGVGESQMVVGGVGRFDGMQ